MLDAVLSVDPLRIYKPRPQVYALVTDAFSIKPQKVVFVSSNRWDVMGAASFGFQALWVNRVKMPDEYSDYPAAHQLPDLAGIASLIR